MIYCHRGDVVLVLFPDSNLRTTKLRPASIVQNDNLASGLQQVIVAMITSNMLRLGPPSRVFVPVGTEATKNSGLLLDSIVMTDNLATIHKSELARVIGPFQDMSGIDQAMRVTLAL